MAGIMSMFSNLMSGSGAPPNANANPNPAPNPDPGKPNNPGNLPDGAPSTGSQPPGAAPNGVLPDTGKDGPDKIQSTPFDKFTKLWEDVPIDPNAPPDSVFGNLDPKKFMEAAGKIDFAKVVTPEQLTAISSGGEAAVKAFAQALNAVSQGVYAQSAFATTKIVEQALNKSKESFLAELPQHIKKETVKSSLRTENPVFSNPAVQPIISALEAQLTVKYPNATATELTTMAKQYVEALGTSFAPKPVLEKGAPKNKKGEVDWSTFLDS